MAYHTAALYLLQCFANVFNAVIRQEAIYGSFHNFSFIINHSADMSATIFLYMV